MSLLKIKNKGLFPTVSNMMDDWFNNDLFLKPVTRTELFPAVNVKETDTEYILEFAVPGMSKEDFEISIDNGMLVISAEKSMETDESDDNYTRREFNYHSFSRSFWLPEMIDEENIKASYENGVLTISIEKVKEIEEVNKKTIAVQ